MLAETVIRWRKSREHRRAAKLTRQELETEKLAKFRRLVRHAVERSPYYRRIVAERGINLESCTPEQFPVLTKSLLMRHFDEIATVPGVTKGAIAEFLTRLMLALFQNISATVQSTLLLATVWLLKS